MKISNRRAVFVLVFSLFATASPSAEPRADGFIPLFNGRDLTGWKAVAKPMPDGKPGDPSNTWSVVDGLLKCTGKPNGYLATEKEFGDYVLRVKWRYPADAKAPNTGVLLHISGPDRYWPNSIEAQMKSGFAGDFWLNADDKEQLPRLDIPATQFDTENKQKRHYFRLAKSGIVEQPLGEWNDFEITCKQGAILVVLNGRKVNEAAGGSLKKGRIGLQSEGSPVEFQDILLRPIK